MRSGREVRGTPGAHAKHRCHMKRLGRNQAQPSTGPPLHGGRCAPAGYSPVMSKEIFSPICGGSGDSLTLLGKKGPSEHDFHFIATIGRQIASTNRQITHSLLISIELSRT
jgi:hypothetical protein